MSEITIKVDVPEESKEEFKRALAKIIEELSDKARIKDFNDEEEIEKFSVEIGRKVNESLYKKYNNK
ncbi:hypothetical protein J4456_02820 [Candidatus Pacearchaeota archaeon]|nr:hypothetical protein [Candidatus Pacearchaeota archaeon]